MCGNFAESVDAPGDGRAKLFKKSILGYSFNVWVQRQVNIMLTETQNQTRITHRRKTGIIRKGSIREC
jgi:hypothetical protein